ncbi:MAG: MbtH family NRPS accessory protein [Ketobacter sp.]|nr:MbtH family NRPS accessory protein [Ketobacter sp.]
MVDEFTYLVVVNDEEQYSIWPTFKESLPIGWRAVGFQGDKAACLERISELWVDMRPKSLREAGVSKPGMLGNEADFQFV